jgi:SM-20-related protein
MQPAAPLIETADAIAPPEVHAAVWATCTRPAWNFGHQTDPQSPGLPFWKMDLDGVEPVDALWRLCQPRCEGTARRRLRVVRQYANGHTYGQGGQPHVDDVREGCFTLLYYPMLQWHPLWEGETLFFDARSTPIAAIAPVPNRGVFFDSRIPHVGRAPSRLCTSLRVTIAFKLEPQDGSLA